MGERDDAQGQVAAARERLSEVVDELARRSSGRYVARQTKEAAVRKTSEWTQRAGQSPAALGFLGGAVGAGIGAAIAARAARRELPTGHDAAAVQYPDPEAEDARRAARTEAELEGDSHQRMADLRARAQEGKEQIKQKAHGALDDMRGRAGQLRQRAGRTGQIKGEAASFFRSAVEEQPLLLGLGAILLGLIAARLFPETEPEQRTMGPIKERVRGQVDRARERVEEMAQAGPEAPATGYPEGETPPALH